MYFLIEFIEKINELPYNEILSVICGLYVGLIALMYPKLFEMKKEIHQISAILYNKLSNKLVIKVGFLMLIVFIVFNIVSFCFKNNIMLIINGACCLLELIISYYLYEFLFKNFAIEFNLEKILKKPIEKQNINFNIELDKNDIYKNNIRLLQDLSIYTLKNNNLEKFRDCIDFILEYFTYYSNLIKDKKNYLNLTDQEKEYFVFPLERIQYISQELIDHKIKGTDYIFVLTDYYFKTIAKFYHKNKANNTDEYGNFYILPLIHFVNYLLYKIKNNGFEKYEKEYLMLVFILSIKLDIDYKEINIDVINYESCKNIQKYTFLLMKELVDYNYDNIYIVNFMEQILNEHFFKFLNKEENSKFHLKDFYDESKPYYEFMFDYIYNINFSILSYTLKVENYDLLVEIINLFNKNVRYRTCDVQNIFDYLIYKKNSILGKNNILKVKYNNEEYNEENNKKYKYYAIFVLLINIKNSIDLNIKQNKNNNTENREGIIKTKRELNTWVKSRLKFRLEDNLSLTDIQYIDFDKIDEYLDDFFNNENFLNYFKNSEEKNSFYIDLGKIESYKKFIKKRFRLLKFK